jgi:ribonucleoside-diphosphate reductase subunit M1
MTNDGFSHEALADVTAKLVRNLNLIIDRTTTPPSARVSNLKHRPIGIGEYRLADVFTAAGFAFDSEESRWSAASSA